MSNEFAKLELHEGEALMKLAATYPTLSEVVEEQIQNALDSGATNIQVRLNQKTRHIAIRDNGRGASTEKFNQALHSVGKTIKKSTDLGQFGLGLISPLGKCEYSTFTSCPNPNTNGFREWTFKTADLKKQKRDVELPVKDRVELIFSPEQTGKRSGAVVWWRTEVAIFKYTTDKYLSAITLQGLADSILDKYTEKMSKLGTTIRITFIDKKGKESETVVKATSFAGKRIPEHVEHEPDSGDVIFRMYVAKKRDRERGRVNIRFGVIGNDFRFNFSNFARSTARELLNEEILDAMRSGILEGEILGQRVQLTEKRTCFRQSDALVGFCICIQNWFENVGKDYFDIVKQERQEQRYQDLGVEALSRLEKMLLGDPNTSHLLETIKSGVQTGNIDDKRRALPGSRVGTDKDPSLTSKVGGGKKSNGSSGEADPHKRHNADATPFTVKGPSGKQRKIVKGNNTGLTFVHDDLGASSKLWEFDIENGILYFNITHPNWVQCDKRDWMIVSLMENIAFQALALHSMPDKDFHMVQRQCLDTYTDALVAWISSGGGMRTGHRKKAKT